MHIMLKRIRWRVYRTAAYCNVFKIVWHLFTRTNIFGAPEKVRALNYSLGSLYINPARAVSVFTVKYFVLKCWFSYCPNEIIWHLWNDFRIIKLNDVFSVKTRVPLNSIFYFPSDTHKLYSFNVTLDRSYAFESVPKWTVAAPNKSVNLRRLLISGFVYIIHTSRESVHARHNNSTDNLIRWHKENIDAEKQHFVRCGLTIEI